MEDLPIDDGIDSEGLEDNISPEQIQVKFRETTRQLFPQLRELSAEELDAQNDEISARLAAHPLTEAERSEILTKLEERVFGRLSSKKPSRDVHPD